VKVDLRRLVQRFTRRGFAPPPSRELGGGSPLARLPLDYREAAARLRDMSVIRSQLFRDRAFRVSFDGCHPDLIRFKRVFLADLHRAGMPFFVFQAMRSREDQDRAFASGVSKAKGGQSAHNFGMAIDVVHFPRFWDLTTREWDVIGAIGADVSRRLSVPVVWGGSWEFYDPAHWELADWKVKAGLVPAKARA